MAHGDNSSKYSVNAKLLDLASRLTALEKENADLRVHLKGALQTAVNDAKNIIQDSIRVPQDGKDGESIVGPKGETGEPGETLWLNAADHNDVIQYTAKIRKAYLELHARVFESLDRQIKDNSGPHAHSMMRVLVMTLERIKREIGPVDIRL
jgi:hypothetical protein